jgi:NAD(P)-dependent dehydrogenase (short-subunit alcohol dehydrogenase family)
MTTPFSERSGSPLRPALLRVMSSMWKQRERSVVCPPEPRLDGRLALVTGGNAGIGLEIGLGLAHRGAEVIVAARDEVKARDALERIQTETNRVANFISLDLSDLGSVRAAADQLGEIRGDRRIDVLVANAGVWPTRYAASAQGHEIAFATNVLGHHVLIRRLIDDGTLADDARVVIVTGDIYSLVKDCTPDYRYRSAWGGQLAYCRSKLGNLWQTYELARRYPELTVVATHPGVVDSGLIAAKDRVLANIKRRAFLPVKAGAQAPLYCATQPDVVSGAYYHNLVGRVLLNPDDAAADRGKAKALWEALERLGLKGDDS